MSAEIVIVDNGGQFTHLEGRALRELGVPNKIVKNTESVDEVIDSEPAGLILSGGPSIQDTGNSVEYLEHDKPVLGICLGHQLIARKYGGKVSSGDYGGYADVEVEVLEDSGVLRGLGDKLSVWASHQDEVVELPDGFQRSARSDVCEIEAMQHESRPIYSVQWHPEVSHTEKGYELLENFVDIARRN